MSHDSCPTEPPITEPKEMTRQEIEDAADKARDAAADRSEALDQREAELSGKIEDLEQRIVLLRDQRNVEVGRNMALNKQLNAATELLGKVEDERDALRKLIERAIERTQNVVLYCGATLSLLRAPTSEIERETHGTA